MLDGLKNKSLFIILGFIFFVLLIVYIAFSFFYNSHFYPNTTLNGINISNLSASKAEDTIENIISSYSLNVTDRDGNTYVLTGSDFQITYIDDGTLEDELSEQNSLLWFIHLFSSNNIEQEYSDFYETAALESAILALDCFNLENVSAPTNAYLEASEEDESFIIIEETQGNTLIEETALLAIEDAVNSFETDVILEDECYESPTVTSDDEIVADALEIANSYVNATITYDITGSDEVVDASTIMSWVVIDEDFNVSLDEDAIASYVQYLASTYNTYADEREFTTSLGDTIIIGGGDYGWVIDKTEEKAEIILDLESGEATEREPIYSQTALQQGDDDIGDTYVEIDYSNQHLYYYVDGVLQLDTAIVSGNLSNGNGSPDGVFKIVYKQSPATLVGEDYESDVEYFMPFAYNVGIHDASWRSEFGGVIYKTSGSHGCINIPESAAEELYSLISTGTPVIAYYRESVELTSNSAKQSNAYSYVEEDE